MTRAGRSAAETSFASRCDSPKNRGSTSSQFSGVSTRATSVTVDMQSRPLRRAASTAGNA
jgi:hypothetical protein